MCLLFQGNAIEYLLNNIFTEAAGARKAFPKVAMIITDGKSQDPVEEYARRLRNIGVEIFVLGTFFFVLPDAILFVPGYGFKQIFGHRMYIFTDVVIYCKYFFPECISDPSLQASKEQMRMSSRKLGRLLTANMCTMYPTLT